ncbi:MAG: hypothetical protein K0S74_1531 [Chlamydiales bacterium]|jgi:hypothetical protein|nr:hypothetical protein [Chlamydiales bacterium]
MDTVNVLDSSSYYEFVMGLTERSDLGVLVTLMTLNSELHRNMQNVFDRRLKLFSEQILLRDRPLNFFTSVEFKDLKVSKKIFHSLIEQKLIDPKKLIKAAVENNDTHTMHYLLKSEKIDLSDDDNYAIVRASQLGFTGIVAQLIKNKNVDPLARDNAALKQACSKGHKEVVKILFKDKRVNTDSSKKLAVFCAQQGNHEDLITFIKKHKQGKLKKAFNKAKEWIGKNYSQ